MTIVFMSRAYLKSDWYKYELQMAITEEPFVGELKGNNDSAWEYSPKRTFSGVPAVLHEEQLNQQT